MDTWNDFVEWILGPDATEELIYRGQADADWPLWPTLVRLMVRGTVGNQTITQKAHLERFREAALGRRGLNPPVLSEEQWWALGQHHGLATVYLDWTYSPMVAAFFALYEPAPSDRLDARRAIWALNSSRMRTKAHEIESQWTKSAPAPVPHVVRPLSDENQRLLNQRSVFTRSDLRSMLDAPELLCLESWVTKHFQGQSTPVLYQITLPASDAFRYDALRLLNRMNISPLTLFPDVYGAAQYANLAFEIEG